MLSKVIAIKNKYEKLGKYTKLIIRISLTFVFTCLFLSLFCFILKDSSKNYIFFYRTSEELLIAGKSCAVLGLIFSIIGIKTELQ